MLCPHTALRIPHCLVYLLRTYRQKLKSAKPLVKTVRRWTNKAKLELQASYLPQTFHNHPGPQETFYHRIKQLQALRLDTCGYEILWNNVVDPPGGHHRPPAGALVQWMMQSITGPRYMQQDLDFSSAFNTSSQKSSTLNIPSSLCQHPSVSGST